MTDKILGSTNGLTLINEAGKAFVSSEFNSGYMVGDCKLATLSDTTAETLVGTELVTNGTFDTDISGWTATNVTTSVSGGQVTVTNSGESNGTLSQSRTTVVGKTYVLTGFAQNGTGTGRIYVGSGYMIPSGSTSSLTFVATSITTTISLLVFGADGTDATFDNISFRLAVEDRSVNGNGLQIFGTITKATVATGADLVGFSNFGANNYIQQPYNSALDVATGDFSIMGWVAAGSISSDCTILTRATSTADGIEIRKSTTSVSPTIRVKLAGEAELAGTTLINNSTIMHHFAVVRVGGILYLYIDGKLEASQASTADISVVAPTQIGWSTYVPRVAGVSKLAQVRISATAPTAEQIAKIYNDEKGLFQENAQATLYGTSDSATALAYDKVTKLTHVGTIAGRSVFSGLQRVDNTTTAVTTAISANNDLVGEQ